MTEWMEHLSRIADRLLLEPVSTGEIWTILAISILIAIPVFTKVAEACRIPNTGNLRSVVVIVLGVVILSAAMTAASIYLEPKLSGAMAKWCIPLVGIVSSLFVVVPLIAVIMRGPYIGSLMAWGITCLAVAATIWITASVWDIFLKSGEKMDKGKQRRDSLQEVIDK